MTSNPPEGMPRVAPYLLYEDLSNTIDWMIKDLGVLRSPRTSSPLPQLLWLLGRASPPRHVETDRDGGDRKSSRVAERSALPKAARVAWRPKIKYVPFFDMR